MAFSSKSVSKNVTPVWPIARRAVDERDLAEVRRALVERELALDDVGALFGANVDDAAGLEPHLEPADDRAR